MTAKSSKWDSVIIYEIDTSYTIPFESIQGLNVKRDIEKLYPDYTISDKAGRIHIPLKGSMIFDLLNQKLELSFIGTDTTNFDNSKKSGKNKPRGKVTKLHHSKRKGSNTK